MKSHVRFHCRRLKVATPATQYGSCDASFSTSSTDSAFHTMREPSRSVNLPPISSFPFRPCPRRKSRCFFLSSSEGWLARLTSSQTITIVPLQLRDNKTLGVDCFSLRRSDPSLTKIERRALGHRRGRSSLGLDVVSPLLLCAGHHSSCMSLEGFGYVVENRLRSRNQKTTNCLSDVRRGRIPRNSHPDYSATALTRSGFA